MQPTEHALRDGRRLGIRPAEVEDASALIEHLAAVASESDFLAFGAGELRIGLHEEEQFIRTHRETGLRLFLVAVVEGRLVGSLTFSGVYRPRLQHNGELGVSVRRAYWGLGVGSALLDTLIHWARSTGIITKLNLRVRTDNVRAIQLYQRKGFSVEGTVSRELLIEGRYFSQHCMGLEL